MTMTYLMQLIFIFSIITLTLNFKNILMMLISLEFLMINTIFILYFYLNMIQMNMYFNFIFLTLSICEGVLGLSILIYMIRCSGNDYLNLINTIKW